MATVTFSFDRYESVSSAPIAPTPGADAGPRDPSLVQDWRAVTVAFAPETGPSRGGMLSLREVEKMFGSDPVAERGVNTAQTEEDKVKHLERMFLLDFPLQ